MLGRRTHTEDWDPREAGWLLVVTALIPLGLVAIGVFLFADLQRSFVAIVSALTWLTTRPLLALQNVVGAVPGVGEIAWVMLVVGWLWTVALGALIGLLCVWLLLRARRKTRRILQDTYTSSAQFRLRRAATLRRLDEML